MRSRVLGLALAILAGCSTTVPVRELSAGPSAATVFVVDRGWHTDIGLAVQDVHAPLSTVEQGFPGVRYVLFGFGDRAYLLSRHPTLLGDITALFPDRGAILVTALRAPPAEAFDADHVVPLGVSSAGIERLNEFLWAELRQDRSGAPLRIADGPYAGSVFYASSGTYDALFTCNTWTADALYAAGLPVRGSGVLFAAQLMRRVRSIARASSDQSATQRSARN